MTLKEQVKLRNFLKYTHEIQVRPNMTEKINSSAPTYGLHTKYEQSGSGAYGLMPLENWIAGSNNILGVYLCCQVKIPITTWKGLCSVTEFGQNSVFHVIPHNQRGLKPVSAYRLFRLCGVPESQNSKRYLHWNRQPCEVTAEQNMTSFSQQLLFHKWMSLTQAPHFVLSCCRYNLCLARDLPVLLSPHFKLCYLLNSSLHHNDHNPPNDLAAALYVSTHGNRVRFPCVGTNLVARQCHLLYFPRTTTGVT